MLTVEQLKAMPPNTLFDAGTFIDGVEAHINNTGKSLRFVAVRGGIADWAIYVAPTDWADEAIARNGDKVFLPTTIQALVPCTPEALKLYRR